MNYNDTFQLLHHLDFNPFQHALDNQPNPIDPRLKDLNHTLVHRSATHSGFLSYEPLQPKSHFNQPPFDFPLDDQIHWKGLALDDQIEALLGASITATFDSNNSQDLESLTTTPPIRPIENLRNDHDSPLIQPTQTSSFSISTEFLGPQQPHHQANPSSAILVDHPNPPIAESSIDPFLETLDPSPSIPSFALSPSSQTQSSEHAQNQAQRKISKPFSPSLPLKCPTSSCLNLSQVDVHGAGAGGGAAAVLEAVAAQQQLKNPSTCTVNWSQDGTTKTKKPNRERPMSKSSHHQKEAGSNNDQFDIELTPTNYNPDQYRSWNRIHWTQEEEQLLLDEVELHWHHYDCMAQIMKRHGPKGTISTTFADRTGVSLKDKAVNISSRWYRDGAEISPTRRRAFARFRPKQLKGKPKNQLPGMIDAPGESPRADLNMAIKRHHAGHDRHSAQHSMPMSPSSASSSGTDTAGNRTKNRRPKKIIRRDTNAASEGKEEGGEGGGEDVEEDTAAGDNSTEWKEEKKKYLVEHAKRRLSGRHGTVRKSMNFDPPSSNPSPARIPPTNARVGALARARENHARARQSIGIVAPTDNPLVISTEVMNNNYDEWMKMATDNKINVNNTWSFALIDYFHDMSLLRNPESEGGINFQKASCTLDGCVKIWTSRVDSVATETGKLLSGLAEEANNIANQIDGEDDEEVDDESAIKSTKKTRTRATHSSSLVDFNEKIKVKELELEFTVDPLFKKTCADFDEGGSGGILMSHLSVDSSMTIIFDASGKPFSQNSDDNSPEEDEPQQLLDVSKLKSAFVDSFETFQARSICPCLSNFKFSSSDSIQTFESLAALVNLPEKEVDPAPISHDTHDNGGNDFFDSGDSPNLGEDNFQLPDHEDVDDEDGIDMAPGFNPSHIPNQRDLLMALVDDHSKQGEPGQSIFGQESTGMFDYFDKSMKKSWAGPEHWKLRKTVAFKSRDDENQTTVNRTKREKSTFSFDFTEPLEITRKAIFQTSSTSLTLPGYKPPKPKSQRKMIKKIVGSKAAIGSKQMMEQHCLPDDMHFNASQLLRFDMKPKTTFNMRVKASGSVAHHPGAEIDENYWARTAAAAAAQNNPDQTEAAEESNDGIPFATQFFQDEGDDQPDFEEEFDNPVGSSSMVNNLEEADKLEGSKTNNTEEEQDLIAATQNLNVRVRPEFVNYAKKAKRVDVKRLKENIWRELEDLTTSLTTTTGEEEKEEKDSTTIPVEEQGVENISKKGGKTFTKVIKGLRNIYPQEKMEEISTSFCFICLLHLANEKGLTIHSSKEPHLTSTSSPTIPMMHDGDGDGDPAGQFVGRLEELHILKESS